MQTIRNPGALAVLVLVLLGMFSAMMINTSGGEVGGLPRDAVEAGEGIVPLGVTITLTSYWTVTRITVTVSQITVTPPTFRTITTRTVTVTRITVTPTSYPTITRITVTMPGTTVMIERLKTTTVVSTRTATVVREGPSITSLEVTLPVAVVVGFIIVGLALYFRPRLKEPASKRPI